MYSFSVLIMKHMKAINLGPVLCLTMLLSGLVGAPFAHPLSVSTGDFAKLRELLRRHGHYHGRRTSIVPGNHDTRRKGVTEIENLL